MMSLGHGWGWLPPQTASLIHTRHLQSVWAHWYAVHRHEVAALHSYPPYLAQILGFLVTYGVEMMSLHHGWGWQLPQTASQIYIRHIQSVWAHQYAIYRHKVAALHRNPPYFAQIWGSGSLMWSQYDVVRSWLRLTAASNSFSHPYWKYTMCLSTSICCP